MFSWHALFVTRFALLGQCRAWASAWAIIACTRTVLISFPGPLEYFLALCGTLSLEGGPIFWVATHRIHHQYSDKPGDPHSPRDGAWWSHIGWLLVGESKHNDTKLMAKYAPDLAKRSVLRHT